jgi:hypothetical protein
VQAFLTDLESDPERVRPLTWRDWIDTAVQGRPATYAA